MEHLIPLIAIIFLVALTEKNLIGLDLWWICVTSIAISLARTLSIGTRIRCSYCINTGKGGLWRKMAGILRDSYRSLVETTYEEQWKDIDGYDGIYQVSTAGRVRSNPRKVHNYTKPGRYLRQSQKENGYLYISLVKPDGTKSKHEYIHRLVADAFIPNPKGLTQVNHKNSEKDDNRVENLEWVTPQENSLHFRKSKLAAKYDEKKRRTLINKSIQYILDYRKTVCDLYATGKSIEEVAKIVGIGRDRVRDILCIYEFV